MAKITLPLFVLLPRKTMPARKIIINLNSYRNWHYIVSNLVKEQYTLALKDQLEHLKFNGKISLMFILYKASNRTSDRSNVLSIQEKFFCDALTHYGCIPDDNDEIIYSTSYFSGELDKINPRVEVFIQEI
ncbi:MAG: hypothetical protein WA057_01605 [Candidatus Magasanikiibacteriota bacterium]